MITLIKNKLFPAPQPVQNKLPENKVIPNRFGIKITDKTTITAVKIMGAIAGLAALGFGVYGYSHLNQKMRLPLRADFLNPTPFDTKQLEPIIKPSDVDGSGEIPSTQAFDENVPSEETLSTKSMLGIAALIMIPVCKYLYSGKSLPQNSNDQSFNKAKQDTKKFLPKSLQNTTTDQSASPPIPPVIPQTDQSVSPPIPPPPPRKEVKSPPNSSKPNISGDGSDKTTTKSPKTPSLLPRVLPKAPTQPQIQAPTQPPEIVSFGPPQDLPPSLPKICDLESVYQEFHDTEVKFNDHLRVRLEMCKFFTDEKIHSLASGVSKEAERGKCCKCLKKLFNKESWSAIYKFSSDMIKVFEDFANQPLPERQSQANDYAERLIDSLTKISDMTHTFSEINVAIARSIHFVDAFKAVKHPWKTAMFAFKSNNTHPTYSNLESISEAFILTPQRFMRYSLFIERILKIVENETLLEPGTKDRLKVLHNNLHKAVLTVNENQRNKDERFENWKKTISVQRDKDSKTLNDAHTLAQAIVKAKKKDRCLEMNSSGVIQCSHKAGLTAKKISFKSTEMEIKTKAQKLLTDAVLIAKKRFEEKEEGTENIIKNLDEALPLLDLIKQKKEEKKKDKPQSKSTLVLK